jgi:hypothetical protein
VIRIKKEIKLIILLKESKPKKAIPTDINVNPIINLTMPIGRVLFCIVS